MHIHIISYLHVVQAFQNFLSSKPYLPNIFALSTPEIIIKYHICMFTVSLMLINDHMACR